MIHRGYYQLHHGHQAQWCDLRVPIILISGLALTLRSLRSWPVSGTATGRGGLPLTPCNEEPQCLRTYQLPVGKCQTFGRALPRPHLDLPFLTLGAIWSHVVRQVCDKWYNHWPGIGILYALNWISTAAKRRNCWHYRPAHRKPKAPNANCEHKCHTRK